jgi:hypothetical protein
LWRFGARKQACRGAGACYRDAQTQLPLRAGAAQFFTDRVRAAKQPFETGEIEDDLIRCMQFESRGEIGRDFEQRIGSRAIDRTKRAKHDRNIS